MENKRQPINWVRELERIMGVLRSENGCLWDKEQTHETLKKYLIEETYELIEAIEAGSDDQIMDELGDLLLQVIFHCQIAQETNRFNLQMVAEICCKKLIRRHPHVFGDKKVKDSDEVLREWHRIKKSESLNQRRKSRLDGIPKFLPALMYAAKIQGKASQAGFDWKSIEGVWEKFDEEIIELRTGIERNDSDQIKEELGDLMFTLTNLCRFLGVSAEDVLRYSNRKFTKRFRFIEDRLAQQGREFENCSDNELDELWQDAKSE